MKNHPELRGLEFQTETFEPGDVVTWKRPEHEVTKEFMPRLGPGPFRIEETAPAAPVEDWSAAKQHVRISAQWWSAWFFTKLT